LLPVRIRRNRDYLLMSDEVGQKLWSKGEGVEKLLLRENEITF